MKNQWTPDICIYHGDCLDGFGAAWAIWRKWRQCEFRPGFYGKPLPIDGIHGKNILFVDFSASVVNLEAIGSVAESVVILDHHKTAEADLQLYVSTLPMEAFETELATCDHAGKKRIVAFFDMERSGASLAWEFAHGSLRVPRLVQHIEDRDLWRFRYGNTTRAIAAALKSYPKDFIVWQELSARIAELITEGIGVMRAEAATVATLAREAYPASVGGFQVPVANAPYQFASETCHELLRLNPEAPFVGTWYRTGDGRVVWSLRSEPDRADVSEIARRFGGGGHRNAAGFQEAANV